MQMRERGNSGAETYPAKKQTSCGRAVWNRIALRGDCRPKDGRRNAPSRGIRSAAPHGMSGSWRHAVIGTLGILMSTAAGAQVNFSDIKEWIGTGQNQAAFVIDWKLGAAPQSQVWGYRWDGTATGTDMINAIVGADRRLYREWAPGYVNEFIFGYGLDRNGNGFSKLDPADSYQEGFFTNGFWGYYVDVAPSSSLPAWTFASTGAAGRVLTDGSWDGWSWAQNFNGTDPSIPIPISAPVPEPGGVALWVSASAVGVLLRRKTRQS